MHTATNLSHPCTVDSRLGISTELTMCSAKPLFKPSLEENGHEAKLPLTITLITLVWRDGLVPAYYYAQNRKQ